LQQEELKLGSNEENNSVESKSNSCDFEFEIEKSLRSNTP
jgi:hypothetical protein